MRAKDVMSDGVVSVGVDATVFEVAELLVNSRVSALPVVDEHGFMVGIVSEADLIRRSEVGVHPDAPGLLRQFADDLAAADAFVKAHSRRVVEIMTRPVITANEDATLGELSETMQKHGVKRIPILRRRTVVGIVSRADLLQALISRGPRPDANQAPSPSPTGVPDDQLRGEVVAAVRGRSWSLAKRADVVISDGVAHLWGVVPSDMVRKAYRVAAENVPGVRSVENHMHIVRPPPTRLGLR